MGCRYGVGKVAILGGYEGMAENFSEKTKNELARIIPKQRCCRIAELSAFYDFNGYLMGEDGRYLDINHSSPLVARKILNLVKGLFPTAHIQILVQRARSRKNQVCTVRVLRHDQAQGVHATLVKQQHRMGEPRILEKRCCRRAYVRGAFLSHGSVTNPERTYHLEIFTDKTEIANRVIETINSLQMAARMTTRKGNRVVYLKDGEQIVTLLNLMGAHSALLQLENIRIVKDVRNQVNRLVNCETANVDKTVQASMEQLDDIQVIQAHMDLRELSPKLYQIAKLRLKNPYASLMELGEMAVPSMSKSGVNYRIRQIHKLRQKLAPSFPSQD